jgi:uncharacterized phage infection (PIP) family protein YhgE
MEQPFLTLILTSSTLSSLIIMRFILLGFVIGSGFIIGTRAIHSVSNMQDAKMTRFCQSIPAGASYDDICAKYK